METMPTEFVFLILHSDAISIEQIQRDIKWSANQSPYLGSIFQRLFLGKGRLYWLL